MFAKWTKQAGRPRASSATDYLETKYIATDTVCYVRLQHFGNLLRLKPLVRGKSWCFVALATFFLSGGMDVALLSKTMCFPSCQSGNLLQSGFDLTATSQACL